MRESLCRAKIVCTLGPASRSETVLRRLIRAGMDVARLNFSHGEPAEHHATLAAIRRLAAEEGRTVAVLQDLQGPKLRVGTIPNEPLQLRRGGSLVLTTRAAGPGMVPVSYKQLPQDVKRGDRILLDDGLIQLTVTGVTPTEVRCRVVEGGPLTSHKGINLPGRALSVPSLTTKDRRDLELGIAWGVDYVALSFVREAKDVDAVKRVMKRHHADIPVIAKLEKPQAVDNLEAILKRADGIMVARGDLGVELPPEEVPVLQKRMIRLARAVGKPVITATQMLESMIEHRHPTRAEASDVANAVFDGTDAVMLSGETAVGKYPVEAVKMMARVVRAAEKSVAAAEPPDVLPGARRNLSVPDAVAEAASLTARDLGAKVIAVFTQSGGTARVVSKYRPQAPIHAFTPSQEVMRRLALIWGVRPHAVKRLPTSDAMVKAVEALLLAEKVVRRGDLVVVTGGTPVNQAGSTNFMKIHRVGS